MTLRDNIPQRRVVNVAIDGTVYDASTPYPVTGKVILTDSSGNLLAVDSATWAQTGIDYAHHEIHDGSAYFVTYSALKADTEFIELRVQAPDNAKWAHMVIGIKGALAGTTELWRATTKTHVGANAIVPLNRNFNSNNTSGLTICHTPAGTQTGAARLLEYYGASATGGRVAVGGNTGGRDEFILKQAEAILIKNTSRADGNALMIDLSWYEHTNK